jgi:aminoacyl-tRNA hydrolase
MGPPRKSDVNMHLQSRLPVVTGLGNPGRRYNRTAHNAGYLIVDHIADTYGAVWRKIPEGQISDVTLNQTRIRLFKSAANMNNCGPLIKDFLAITGIGADQCMIIHDDIDLELGQVRLKRDGGDAGHNGVRSVISALGTDAVYRLRIGVRRSGSKDSARESALSRFTSAEAALLAPVLRQAVAIVEEHIRSMSSPNRTGSPLHQDATK